MKKNLLDEWGKVAESHDCSIKRNAVKNVSFQDLYDAALAARKEYQEKKDQLEEAQRNYRLDCAEKDNSLNSERESLKKEIDMQEKTIKDLSKKLRDALISHDRNKVPHLRQQISEATMLKDEALATLNALSDVVPDYDENLLQKAELLKEPEQEAWNVFGEKMSQIRSMREALEDLFDYNSAEFRQLAALHTR